MYVPQDVYYPIRVVERLLYAIAVWHTLTEDQQELAIEIAEF